MNGLQEYNFRAKCAEIDKEFERERTGYLEARGKSPHAHQRKLWAVESIAHAWKIKRARLAELVESGEFGDAAERLLAGTDTFLRSHAKLHAKYRATFEEEETKRLAGRSVLVTNYRVGLARLEAEIEEEVARHELAVLKARGPDDVAREDAKHASACELLSLRVDVICAALENLGWTGDSAPSTADSVEG